MARRRLGLNRGNKMKKKTFEDYENIIDEFYNNMSIEELMIHEKSETCYNYPDLYEAYSSILNEKLTGDIVNHEFSDNVGYYGGLYNGKKFSAGYTIQNFGRQVDNKDELEINQKYNIYIEHYDMWVMGYRLKAVGVGQYKFKLDNKSETEKFNIKRLYNTVKKGYIIKYSN